MNAFGTLHVRRWILWITAAYLVATTPVVDVPYVTGECDATGEPVSGSCTRAVWWVP